MALALALAALVHPASADMSRVTKRGSLSPLVARARDRGRAPRADRHRVVVGLSLRQREALEAFLADVQDPASPRYHQFLTQDEFNALYAPDPGDEEAVVAHLEQSGLTVTDRAPNRLLVGAVGSTEDLERAFGVELHALDYRGRRHFAAMGEPSLPADIAASVVGVIGLDDLVEPHPHFVSATPVAAPRAMLTSPPHCCSLAPLDIAHLYDDGGTYDGSGETIVIAGAYAWSDGDNIGFDAQWSLPALPAGSGQVCTGPAASAACQFSSSNSIEVALDAEYAHGVAPNARIINYMAKTTNLVDFTTAYNRIVTDNPGHIVTTSWGACEADIPAGTLNADDAIFANANAIGQSWFAASGDSGSRDCNNTLSVDNPASSPHVIGVGGTTPTCSSGLTSGTPTCGGYGSESAWSGSGGGISTFARPSFQTACGVPAGSKRLVPDVALEADPSPGNYILKGGSWFIVAGTSVAAPEWAGFLAELDQRAGGTGFGNPGALLYGLCGTSAFHDVTSGSNGDYSATAGYDMVTGLGSLAADTLFAAAVPTPGSSTTTLPTTSTTSPPSTSTTTTTPVIESTTTTTIPPCPADGFSGLDCALDGGLARPECAGDFISRRLARKFRLATRLIARAEHTTKLAQAGRLMKRSAATLGSLQRLVEKSGVTDACKQALLALLQDGQARAQRLAASLQALSHR